MLKRRHDDPGFNEKGATEDLHRTPRKLDNASGSGPPATMALMILMPVAPVMPETT